MNETREIWEREREKESEKDRGSGGAGLETTNVSVDLHRRQYDVHKPHEAEQGEGDDLDGHRSPEFRLAEGESSDEKRYDADDGGDGVDGDTEAQRAGVNLEHFTLKQFVNVLFYERLT